MSPAVEALALIDPEMAAKQAAYEAVCAERKRRNEAAEAQRIARHGK